MHYAINYSIACNEGGSGQCDGFVPRGEGNPRAINEECSCPCHDTIDLPDTVEGVKVWHDSFYNLDDLTADDLIDLDAERANREATRFDFYYGPNYFNQER